MGKGKKALVTALAVGVTIPALAVPMSGEVKAAEFNGFTYTDNGDGTATITGYSDTASKDVMIPGEIGGLTVKSIGDRAFYEKDIETLKLPSKLENIGKLAFSSNKKLTEITLPESLVNIGESAFSYGGEVRELIIPKEVKNIGINAFRSTIIPKVTIYGHLGSIGTTVFMYSKVKELYVKGGIKSIGDQAFYNMGLDKVEINSVEVIGESAFKLNNISNIVLPEGIKTIKGSAFSRNSIERLVIPKSLTSIGEYAFNDNKISEIQIPSSVTTMPSNILDGNQFVPSYLKVYGQGGSRAHAVALENGYTFNDGEAMPNPPTLEPEEPVDPPAVEPTPEEPEVDVPTETPAWSFADPTAPFIGVKPTITLVGGKPANDIVITNVEWVTEETVVTTPQGDVTLKPDGKGNTLVSAKDGLGDKKTATTVNVEFEGTHFMNINIKAVPVLNFNFSGK